mmetsp:Transcript_32741/g.24164  ORF Transcript_32741/g.24164 Transcript_32741/m.24164 type:complete len:122 (-) Transcript_32741:111-476(-)
MIQSNLKHAGQGSKGSEVQEQMPLIRSQLLYLVAIPSKISIEEFFNAFLESYKTKIEYVRIIRYTAQKSFYSVIIKLNTLANAEIFYHAFNGRFFGEEQREIMHTVFLSGVSYTNSEEEKS